MIAEYPLIPAEAFRYFPYDNQVKEVRNGQPQRIIFGGGIEFTPEEQKKVALLRKQICKNAKNQKLDGFPDDFLLRFLQATSFDNTECIKALQQYDQWQKKMLPLQISKNTLNILNEGTVYCTGRDCNFRPIVVVDVKKILSLKLSEDDLLNMLGFFYQYLIENCLIEGQVETWVTLIDLGYCGIFSVGGALMDIIKYLSSIFRVRSHHNYLIRCPGAIKILWKMVKGVLNEDQLRKITLSEKSELKPEFFHDNIMRSQVQVKYGGTLPNLTSFWPIQANPHHCYLQNEIIQRLISEESYDKLFHLEELKDRKIKKALIKKYQIVSKSEIENQMSEEDKMTERDEEQIVDERIPLPMEDQPEETFNVAEPFDFYSLILNPISLTKTNTETS